MRVDKLDERVHAGAFQQCSDSAKTEACKSTHPPAQTCACKAAPIYTQEYVTQRQLLLIQQQQQQQQQHGANSKEARGLTLEQLDVVCLAEDRAVADRPVGNCQL